MYRQRGSNLKNNQKWFLMVPSMTKEPWTKKKKTKEEEEKKNLFFLPQVGAMTTMMIELPIECIRNGWIDQRIEIVLFESTWFNAAVAMATAVGNGDRNGKRKEFEKHRCVCLRSISGQDCIENNLFASSFFAVINGEEKHKVSIDSVSLSSLWYDLHVPSYFCSSRFF